VLVLGEKRFLEKRVRDALPAWMQEEMIVCDHEKFREVLAQWKQ
jgi:DNA excision repair protein ERCC-2